MELTLVGSETPYTLTKKVSLMNRSTKGIQRLTNQHFPPFKTNVNKCDFECPIHGVKLKACYLVGTFHCYIMTFSENLF